MKYLISLGLTILIVFICGIVLNIAGYKSAFEADQACHYLLLKEYEGIKASGCDHDIETGQWILFNKSEVDLPAKVIRRFRYK